MSLLVPTEAGVRGPRGAQARDVDPAAKLATSYCAAMTDET